MNWDAIGAMAELLGAIGVIVSLLYLAAQIRDNTQSVRAATYQDFTHESAEITRTLLANPEIIEHNFAFLSGEQSFDPAALRRSTDTHAVQFGLTCGLFLRNLQSAYFEVERGRLDRRLFDSYVSYHVESWVCRPGWLHWWHATRKHYDPAFATWIETRRAEILAAADASIPSANLHESVETGKPVGDPEP